jgi:AcrR family transcriptional regulator
VTPVSAGRRSAGRPTAAGAAELAERILDEATRGFLAQGYAATSIETVAAEAGVAKRTLYARWPDKPALFRAVLERLMAQWLEAPAPPADTGAGPDATLTMMARRALAVALQPEALALHRLMIAECGRFPELGDMVRQSGAAAGIARVAGLFASEMAAGRLRLIDPVMAAEQFLHLVLTGPQRRALGLGPRLDPGELGAWARQAVAIFLGGIRSQESSTGC